MRTYGAAMLGLLALTHAAQAEPVPAVNLSALAGANKATVATLLGAPEQCEPSKYGERCTYKAQHEVIYIKGQADWMTLYVDAPYSPDAVKEIGLDPMVRPATANSNVIRWSPGMWILTTPAGNAAKGLRPGETASTMLESVAVFPRGPKVEYIYVKVSTP